MIGYSIDQVYNYAVDAIKGLDFEPDKEKLLLAALNAYKNHSVEDIMSVLSDLSSEDQATLIETVSTLLTSANRRVENDIIKSGDADAINSLADVMSAEMAEVDLMLDSLKNVKFSATVN